MFCNEFLIEQLLGFPKNPILFCGWLPRRHYFQLSIRENSCKCFAFKRNAFRENVITNVCVLLLLKVNGQRPSEIKNIASYMAF